MDYLEMRLLKIIDLRKGGIGEAEIGTQFGLCSRSLVHYERFIKNSIEGSVSYEEAARKCYISEEVVRSAAEFYGEGLAKT